LADVGLRGGEGVLRRLKMARRVLLGCDGWLVLLTCDGRFRSWSSSGEVYDGELKQDKTYNVNLKWDSNGILQ
jgi:hypothetical protein